MSSRKAVESQNPVEAKAEKAIASIEGMLELLEPEVRASVMKTLAAKKSPEAAFAEAVRNDRTAVEQHLEKLQFQKQYERAINALKADPKDDGGILNPEGQAYPGDIAAPTYEEALAVFTPEMLEKAAKMKDSRLVIVPKDLGRIVRALNAHQKRNNLPETYVNEIFQENESTAITGYEVAFVNGTTDMAVKKGDDLELTIGERAKKRQKKTEKMGIQGMNRTRQGVLLLQSMQEGKPIDKNTWTILDADKAMTSSRVPDARWHADVRQPFFGCYHSDSRDDNARFRSSVGGDVKKA